MRSLFLITTALLLTSCSAGKHVFDSKKAGAYLATHQDRPEPISRALSAGQPAPGMTEEEVSLCWGQPDKRMIGQTGGVHMLAWGYFEPQIVAVSGARTVWRDVLIKEVRFTNGIVREWREIGSGR